MYFEDSTALAAYASSCPLATSVSPSPRSSHLSQHLQSVGEDQVLVQDDAPQLQRISLSGRSSALLWDSQDSPELVCLIGSVPSVRPPSPSNGSVAGADPQRPDATSQCGWAQAGPAARQVVGPQQHAAAVSKLGSGLRQEDWGEHDASQQAYQANAPSKARDVSASAPQSTATLAPAAHLWDQLLAHPSFTSLPAANVSAGAHSQHKASAPIPLRSRGLDTLSHPSPNHHNARRHSYSQTVPETSISDKDCDDSAPAGESPIAAASFGSFHFGAADAAAAATTAAAARSPPISAPQQPSFPQHHSSFLQFPQLGGSWEAGTAGDVAHERGRVGGGSNSASGCAHDPYGGMGGGTPFGVRSSTFLLDALVVVPPRLAKSASAAELYDGTGSRVHRGVLYSAGNGPEGRVHGGCASSSNNSIDGFELEQGRAQQPRRMSRSASMPFPRRVPSQSDCGAVMTTGCKLRGGLGAMEGRVHNGQPLRASPRQVPSTLGPESPQSSSISPRVHLGTSISVSNGSGAFVSSSGSLHASSTVNLNLPSSHGSAAPHPPVPINHSNPFLGFPGSTGSNNGLANSANHGMGSNGNLLQRTSPATSENLPQLGRMSSSGAYAVWGGAGQPVSLDSAALAQLDRTLSSASIELLSGVPSGAAPRMYKVRPSQTDLTQFWSGGAPPSRTASCASSTLVEMAEQSVLQHAMSGLTLPLGSPSYPAFNSTQSTPHGSTYQAHNPFSPHAPAAGPYCVRLPAAASSDGTRPFGFRVPPGAVAAAAALNRSGQTAAQPIAAAAAISACGGTLRSSNGSSTSSGRRRLGGGESGDGGSYGSLYGSGGERGGGRRILERSLQQQDAAGHGRGGSRVDLQAAVGDKMQSTVENDPASYGVGAPAASEVFRAATAASTRCATAAANDQTGLMQIGSNSSSCA